MGSAMLRVRFLLAGVPRPIVACVPGETLDELKWEMAYNRHLRVCIVEAEGCAVRMDALLPVSRIQMAIHDDGSSDEQTPRYKEDYCEPC